MDYTALIPMGIIVVVWYLLRQKDHKRQSDFEKEQTKTANLISEVAVLNRTKSELESDVKILYSLCHGNEKDLYNLNLKLAENHYPKSELDVKFDRLERAFTSSIDRMNTDLGGKLDKLSDALANHVHNK